MRLVTLLVAALIAQPAMAYLDPGSGSMLLQVILGGFAALGVALKIYWHRIMEWFGIRKSTADEE